MFCETKLGPSKRTEINLHFTQQNTFYVGSSEGLTTRQWKCGRTAFFLTENAACLSKRSTESLFEQDMPPPPDEQFLAEIAATGNKPLWDPGAFGYAIYDIKCDVHLLKDIAKRYGMKATYYKATQGLWISRKNATFD